MALLGGCSHDLRAQGLPYPRTCKECGLGPCKSKSAPQPQPTAEPAPPIPHHRHELVIRVGVNDLDDLDGTLRDIATDIALYGPRNTVSGRFSVEHKEDPAMTAETYRANLDRYVAYLRAKRGNGG